MRCDNCNVDVVSDTGYCPLCHEKVGEPKTENRLFPYRQIGLNKEQFDFFNKLYILIGLFVGAFCLLLNYITTKKFDWSTVTFAGIIYSYILIRNTILAKSNLPSKIFIQAVIVCLTLFAIDYFLSTNTKWALEYAIPFVLMTSIAALEILTVFKSKDYKNHIFYLVFTAILGFLPIIFCLLKITLVYWPSFFACLVSNFAIISMIMFHRKKITDEIIKNFHV